MFARLAEERAARDAILTRYETYHATLLAKLRYHALSVWKREQRPVSANDVRHILIEDGYQGDKRLLGQVFNHKTWRRIGTTETRCEGVTFARVGVARSRIGLYIPTDAAFAENVPADAIGGRSMTRQRR
ncbi:MAG TPA: hypothetical protein VH439_17310 [Gemmatimonadales bacterium]|jgi:hypothetical protein